MPNKEMCMIQGRERRFIMQHRHAIGKDKVSTFAHLWDKDMSFRFKTKNLGQKEKGMVSY
jgi:hypothetical protein